MSDFILPKGWRFKFYKISNLCYEFYFDIYAPNGHRWLWTYEVSYLAFEKWGFWACLNEIWPKFLENVRFYEETIE